MTTHPFFFFLDEGELGSSNVQSINIGRQAGISLLGAIGPFHSKMSVQVGLKQSAKQKLVGIGISRRVNSPD